MAAGAVFDQDEDGIVVVLVDEVPEGEEDHAREAVKTVSLTGFAGGRLVVAVEVDDAGPRQTAAG